MAIVQMKKATVITMDQDREETLEKLRTEGVVHLERGKSISSAELSKLETEIASYRQAMMFLPATDVCADMSENRDYARSVVDQVLEIQRADEEREVRLNAIKLEQELLASWDNVDPEDLKFLEENEVFLRFYHVPLAQYDEYASEYKLMELDRVKGFVYAMAASLNADQLPPLESVQFPAKGAEALEAEKMSLGEARKNGHNRLSELSKNRPLMDWYGEVLEEEREFEEARLLCGNDEGISYLTGFVPLEGAESLKTVAERNNWGLILDDPTEEDNVPTELKLGPFASLLKPVLDFLGILPGYREYDISFFFLCFFSIFTAMLIGDAGYGSIFLGLTLVGMIVAHKKTGTINRMFFLPLLMSVSIIIWGAITGTWFASASLANLSFLDRLKLDVFRVEGEESIALIMGISFVLGIIQLLIGVVQNFKKNFPKLSSFAQVGWFAVLCSVWYLILILVVYRQGMDTYPKQMLYVLLGGVAVIFLFGGQEEGKSFVQGILNSLANFLQLFLDVVGTFSDLMSYVRLFAVGLAGVKIAETFNQLGGQFSGSWTIVFGILIVVIGHTLNIILGLMAILVHAVRLNILEYSGKVGVEWSGFKYEPFKVNVEKSQR
jgi:V/A-type H+/Na+-transporting ATPase subunit I